MTVRLEDPEEFGVSAPQPVDSASVARGSFERLAEGQGARAAKRGAGEASKLRDSATGGSPISRKVIVGLVVVAGAVIALVVTLFVRILSGPVPGADDASPDAVPTKAAGVSDATPAGQVAYLDVSYSLVERDGTYVLVEVSDEDGTTRDLGEVPGIPVGLELFDSAILIPENLADGTWDVLAYTIGSGWSQIMGQDGHAQAGSGTIQEARLDGSNLLLDVDGSEVSVPLVW